jgi:hypothetical protein
MVGEKWRSTDIGDLLINYVSGYKIDLYALADIGANGFAFIDTVYAINIAKFLNIKAT